MKINPEINTARNKPGLNLQVSTDEVYGTLGKTRKFVETMPLMPNSPYSASKASADMIVRAYPETYGMPVNITRCSNNYGPYRFRKLIPLMIINCLKGRIYCIWRWISERVVACMIIRAIDTVS